MDTVICSCLKCHAWIGKFENLWDRIGKTYYSPICTKTQDHGGLVTSGEVREAAKTGVIENSFLQDLACKGCGEKLGLRCDNAPAGHILIKDQLILRIGGMSIASADTGEKALLRVRRKFSLTGPQSPSVNRQDGRERSISLIGNRAQAQDEHRPAEFNTAVSNSDGDPLPGLIRFAEWAEDAIASQKKDISRISSIVSKMESDMRSFMDFMVETRRDLDTMPGGRPWERMKRSVTLLEDEVGSIRKELENRPSAAHSNEGDGVQLSVEELDLLTSSITQISQKVNEVESLKMELQFLKTRLKRFEDASRTIKQSVETRDIESSPALVSVPNSSTPRVNRVISGSNARGQSTSSAKSEILPRKRKSDEYESSLVPERKVHPAASSQKKRIPLDPLPTGYWKIIHKPSRLSNVQHVDDSPKSVGAEKFVDGSYSEGDRRPLDDPVREYDSAPETSLVHKKGLPTRQSNRRIISSSPEENSPPRHEAHSVEPALLPRKGSRLKDLQAAKSPLGGHRRAQSEGLRNADGVRLTKNGTPDRRSGNHKYLKQYYEKLRTQKGEDAGPVQEKSERRTDVMPSIEAQTTVGTQDVVADAEAIKQAELEARDRLVRETLEREL